MSQDTRLDRSFSLIIIIFIVSMISHSSINHPIITI